jgi:hypothetical protein
VTTDVYEAAAANHAILTRLDAEYDLIAALVAVLCGVVAVLVVAVAVLYRRGTAVLRRVESLLDVAVRHGRLTEWQKDRMADEVRAVRREVRAAAAAGVGRAAAGGPPPPDRAQPQPEDA